MSFTISQRVSACKRELTHIQNKEHHLDESFRALFRDQRSVRGVFALIMSGARYQDSKLRSRLDDALLAREEFQRRLAAFKDAVLELQIDCHDNRSGQEGVVIGMEDEVIEMEHDTAEFIREVERGLNGWRGSMRGLRKLRGGEEVEE